jgi:hypothetical protein
MRLNPLLGAGYHYCTFAIFICCLLSFHTVSIYISFLYEMPRMLLRFCCIDNGIIEPTRGIIFCKCILLALQRYRTHFYKVAYLICCRTIGNTLLCGIPILQDERRSRPYATKETIAPPKHIPVPIRRTTSTPRMFAQAGLLIMCKRFMTPKKVSTKKMRENLRRLFIDCPFNCPSDSRFS